ncbi:ABC transporter permease [Helcobacillus sp. ACRRO]|uniref:ABC transporter permease n=1 Tax=Helcobacillus TaxID=1161125 RepID=UPI001EF4CC02|nr:MULTISPECIES: ABC transporter permease [Helcobacillus]MCG7427485.1 ABC transporter permease [Helcobacillus sp. ACRRO]MDK7742803.1 ABC transporter permease [Helcobacillus massiliensis]WOO93454.1 ABC transporter permease [Helcobacillus massiliensis]
MNSTAVSRAPITTGDSEVRLTEAKGRLPGWWKMPAALTFFALVSLLVFGIGGVRGQDSHFTIAHDSMFTSMGIPTEITVPSVPTAIVLSMVLLALAGFAWFMQATNRTWPRFAKPALLVGFGVLFAVAFLVWTVAAQSLNIEFLLKATLGLAVPLVFGALSGVLSERAGVINIAIEGQLLFGAFGAAVVGSMTGSPWIGMLAAPLVALVMGALLALFAVGYHVQQIIVGVVLNVLAVGLTSFFYGAVLKPQAERYNVPLRLPELRIPVLADIPLIGPMLFSQNILVYLMWVIVAVCTVALFRTRWGLRVRSVGEHPQAADTVGINVARTRWSNVLLGSAIAGLGGATLTVGTNVAFTQEISAGKGYIALAAMILGRYHPVGAAMAALFFAFATALQQNLGILSSSPLPAGVEKFTVPSEFLNMLPYIVTLLAVAGFVGRVRVPAADGKPYIK